MNFSSLLTVGLGILAGLAWSRRTGWSCGGVITPGILALHASSPLRLAVTLAAGVALTPILSLCAGTFGLYGRERSGAAMILALLLRAFLLTAALFIPYFIPYASSLDFNGVGWVISGLIAADCDRQGVGMTLCGAVSCTIFAAFCVEILSAWGVALS